MNFGDLNEIITSIKKFLKKELKDVDINNLDKSKILEVKKNVYQSIKKNMKRQIMNYLVIFVIVFSNQNILSMKI